MPEPQCTVPHAERRSPRPRSRRLARIAAALAAASLALPLSASAADPFLGVDFDADPLGAKTQEGFESFGEADGPTKSFTTSEGLVSVTRGGQFFDANVLVDDPPAFTFSKLYDDMVYANGEISFTISGLVPGRSYEITWYLFQPHVDSILVENSIGPRPLSPTSNTTGSTVTASYDMAELPTTNEQYAVTGVWTSPDGSLEIDVTDIGAANNFVRVNGFQIARHPECQLDSECDDGLACNGTETCDANQDCQAGAPLCEAVCEESTDTCGPAPTAPLLSVDFQKLDGPANTQDGFTSFAEADGPSKSFATAEGNVAVSRGGTFFERDLLVDAPPFTFARLYDDFIFCSFCIIPITISGLAPGGLYEITWFAFDFAPGSSFDLTTRIRPRLGSATTGPTVNVSYNTGYIPYAANTYNHQFAATGQWTAGWDGTLKFDVLAAPGTPNLVRVNGFQLAHLAECEIDAECDDGDFCNGSETCDPQSHCQAAPAAPCPGLCDELGDTCLTSTLVPLLGVDFETDSSSTETDAPFVAFAQAFLGTGTETFPTPEGDVTVAFTGADQLADRGLLVDAPPDFTFADLYDDFVFANDGGPIQFTLSGLQPETPYRITWYAFDPLTTSIDVANRIEPRAGSSTVGPELVSTYDTLVHPTANDQYAVSGVWTSDTSGSLQIDVSFVEDDFAPLDLVRVNGLQIERVVACEEDLDCDDGAFCNGAEVCGDTGCEAGAPPVLDDGIACTVDTCDELGDVVVHTPDGAVCDNGFFCDGVEVCSAVLGCQAGPDPCPATCDENGNVCTGCMANEECDDELFCTGVETCVDEVCVAGAPPPLDDGVACTFDACDETNDVVSHAPDDAVCSDDVFCDGIEACDAVLGCLEVASTCEVGCDEGGDACLPGVMWASPDIWMGLTTDHDLDHGISSTAVPDAADLVGYHIEESGDRLMSFDSTQAFPGGVVARRGDIVRFTLAGDIQIVFDASAEGVPDGVVIDAIARVEGDLLLSFDRLVTWCGVAATDEDLVRVEAGGCSVFFVGSDAGVPEELDLDAAHYRDADATLMASFDRGACIGPTCFSDEQIVEFSLTAAGWNLPVLGTDPPAGWEAADIDAIAVPEPGQVAMLCAGIMLLAAIGRRRLRR